MSPDSDLSQLLSPHLYRQLQDYQHEQGHLTAAAALNDILQVFFNESDPQSVDRIELQRQVNRLENRVYTLTREVMNVRQAVPDQCDRLREQLAAVRLSHSGLLENLRQRLEALENDTGVGLADPLPLDSHSVPPSSETS